MPFHGASIGKMLTATIVGVLQDKRLINIDDKVSEHLPAATLEGLFVYNSVDYKDDVTIRQLLSHTSGVVDFFESKTNGSLPFVKQALGNPDEKWTPFDLIEFTRNYQRPVSMPGRFFYSDTGCIPLGMVIKKVCGKSFNIALTEPIFKPLGISNSYLMFHNNPSNSQIAPVF